MTVSTRVRVVSVLAAAATVAALADGDPAAGSARSAVSVPALQQSAPATAPTSAGHLRGRVFGKRVLVAYYGSPHVPAMGVLGETGPRRMTERLRKAARPFGRATGKKVQIVYEVIASIADAGPGPDGDYSHFIPTRYVKQYVRAARRHHALVILDLQPGRSSFMSQARHFAWAVRKPWVGLALDPEWRMGPHQVPAQTIGHVKASEVNRVSKWLAGIVHRRDLPQKVFMLHQFRTDMVRNIHRVERRRGLAMVQHVDGFGTQGQKLATYHAVARPRQFNMGFKLFYDEDINRFSAREVSRIKPRVKFVSFQ